ncbi:MAG: hypothetical protein ACLPX8_27355 [Bryobacteraceae bacterium]
MATKRNPNGATGPKTPAGKAVSSMNALRSGLYACTTILPGEDKAEFYRLHGGIQPFYEPENPPQQKLVDEMAALEWKIWRVELIEAGILVELGDAPASACLHPYDRVTQVQCRLRRAWHKVMDRLEGIRIARPPKAPANAKASQPPKPAPKPKPEEELIATAQEYNSRDFSCDSKNVKPARKPQVRRRCKSRNSRRTTPLKSATSTYKSKAY